MLGIYLDICQILNISSNTYYHFLYVVLFLYCNLNYNVSDKFTYYSCNANQWILLFKNITHTIVTIDNMPNLKSLRLLQPVFKYPLSVCLTIYLNIDLLLYSGYSSAIHIK